MSDQIPQRHRVIAGVPLFRSASVVATLCLRKAGHSEEPGQVGHGADRGGISPQEVGRVEEQISLLEEEIASTGKMLRSEGFDSEADILQTHVFILKDGGLRDKVAARIEDGGLSAEDAVAHVFAELKRRLEGSSHEAIREKAADIEDLRRRLSARLSERTRQEFQSIVCAVGDPALVTRELLVSEVLEAREAGVRAIITGAGTPLSHAAIIAKAFDIPVLRVPGIESLEELTGTRVVVDPENGRLILGVTDDEAQEFMRSEDVSEDLSIESPISVYVNLFEATGGPVPGESDIAGVGLYRSEFQLTRHRGFPSEEQQYQEYRLLCDRWAGAPVTIRTFDIGGDKDVSFFSLGPQQNPFLGLRAHRIYAFHPEVLITQLRAILRAGLECGELRILFPMIETIDDLYGVLALVEAARSQLESEGTPYRHDFQVGVLLEVPSAIWGLKEILDKVDFVSVGTNDLLQYHFAVDRTNANISHLYRPYHPAALRLLAHIAGAARAASVPVTLCGEIASDPDVVPLLYGLGYTSLSVDVHAISSVRRAVPRGVDAMLVSLAERCLAAATAEDVRSILQEAGISVPPVDRPETTVPDGARDPVCGMVVHQTGNPFVLEEENGPRYFCSEECMEVYRGTQTQ